MATASQTQAYSATLAATVADRVSITAAGQQGVNVINRSFKEGTLAEPIWVLVFKAGATVSDPTVAGNNCFPVYTERQFVGDTSMTIALISAAANAYTVEKVEAGK